MTDKKLTDEEIIKRLEKCVKRGDRNYDTDIVLDLINRQKAQLADERAKIEICAETISRQDTEIERLKRISVSTSKDSMDFCGVLCDYAEELIDKAKSEAYKEFAKRIKEYCDIMLYGKIVKVSTIDNLLKEMED